MKKRKPNLVYIMADQWRRQAFSFWQKDRYKTYIKGVTDPVHTPHIDTVAEEGLVFTQAVSNYPLCSPYRGMLFSGRFPQSNGVNMNCKAGRTSSLREDITCFTDVLNMEGYHIGYIGKLHLDMPQTHFDAEGNYVGPEGRFYSDGSTLGDTTCWDMATPPGPKRHGINYWHSYGTFDVHKNPHYWDGQCNKHEPKKWSPEYEADKGVAYISNKEHLRDEDKPYCLFISMNPPHNPYGSLEDTDSHIFNTYYKDTSSDDLLNRPNVIGHVAKEHVSYYFSHVTGIDKQIGRILQAIDDSGEKDNTIVVISSDHGEMMGSHDLMGKGVAYDESLLIPLIMRYPSLINPGVNDLLIGGPDIMPTLLGLMGLERSIPVDLDGEDYSTLLTKDSRKLVKPPVSALYMVHFQDTAGKRGLRTHRFTFVLKDIGNGLYKDTVYDNENDIYQMTPLRLEDIKEEDKKFLLLELGTWLKKSNDPWYLQGLFRELIPYD